MEKNKTKSTQYEFVRCDLEFPRFQESLKELTSFELEHFFSVIEKIQKMTWQQVYQTSSKLNKRGINWEPILGQKTASGTSIASIRIDLKIRARVVRESVFMRFISIHRDHDSTYKQKGGELI